MNMPYVSITLIPVNMFQKEKYYMKISSSLAKHWGLINERQLKIGIGFTKIDIELIVTDLEKNQIHLSEEIFLNLHLPLTDLRMLAQYDRKRQTVFFGPIIALLTEINENEDPPNFRSVHSFCEELHHFVSTIGGLFYVFYSKGICQDGVKGYLFQKDEWIEQLLPFPNVIYNRIHSRQLEANSYFQSTLNALKDLNIPLFNNHFLSKWDVYELLMEEDHLQPFVPETFLYSENILLNTSQSNNIFFLKPIHGSQGRNIILLSIEDQQITVKLSTSNNQPVNTFNNIHTFIKWFSNLSKQRSYILQQSIPLIKYKERPLDFRILCHKNQQNIWQVTSVVARIAEGQQFVSNIARGGEIMKPVKVLSELFNRELALQLYSLMKELAVEIATVISRDSEGYFGEFGIDIGVDESEKLWLIEVNSKPSKNYELQVQKIRPSARAIIEYSTMLAFTNMKD